MKDKAIVCNIGHFDNEIDMAWLNENHGHTKNTIKPQVDKYTVNGNDIIILAEGRLVNLGNATGHPSRIMDGSFANQVLAQIHMFKQGYANLDADAQKAAMSVEVLPKQLDEEVARYMVEGFGGVVTKLTTTQADYIGVTVDGPFKPETYRY